MTIRMIRVFVLSLLFAGILAAQDPATSTLTVGNGEVAAQLTVSGTQHRITGRVSFDAILTGHEVLVRAINLAFFGVPQGELAGDVAYAEPLGVLAFASVPESCSGCDTTRINGEFSERSS